MKMFLSSLMIVLAMVLTIGEAGANQIRAHSAPATYIPPSGEKDQAPAGGWIGIAG